MILKDLRLMNHPVNLRKAISISEKNKENSENEKEIENFC
jgi:hypothetical protein